MTSALKRRLCRTKELELLKAEMKQNLPVLTKRQIRRLRIAYDEALSLELIEDEYPESMNFLRSLIEYQDELRQQAGSDSFFWLKPILRDDKRMLDTLCDGLKAAEKGVKEGAADLECDSLLKLGIYFSNRSDWLWLAEQLLFEAVHRAATYKDDGCKRHALCRYVLGRFQLNQMKNAHCAEDHLKICRDLSIGKKWSSREVLDDVSGRENLFKECCSLLYRALLLIGKSLIDTEPICAAKMFINAQKRAIDADDLNGQSECLMQLGLCEMNHMLNNVSSAQTHFNEMLNICFSIKDYNGICEARTQIAIACAKLNKVKESNYHLQSLLDFAFKHKLQHYMGQAHYYLAKNNLNQIETHEATLHFMQAIQLMHSTPINDNDNNQAKTLAAISASEMLLEKYQQLILECKEINKTDTKLISWKDERQPFWIDDDKQNYSILFQILQYSNSLYDLDDHDDDGGDDDDYYYSTSIMDYEQEMIQSGSLEMEAEMGMEEQTNSTDSTIYEKLNLDSTTDDTAFILETN